MTPQSDVRLETGLACGQILYYGGGEVSARHNRVLLTLPVQPVCVAVLTYNLPSFPPSLPPTNTVRLESGSGGGAGVCTVRSVQQMGNKCVFYLHIHLQTIISYFMSSNIVTVQSTY